MQPVTYGEASPPEVGEPMTAAGLTVPPAISSTAIAVGEILDLGGRGEMDHQTP